MKKQAYVWAAAGLGLLIAGCGVHYNTTNVLTVNSINPSTGVSIAVSPADSSKATAGSTSFTRTYMPDTIVTLTAPATSGGNTFSSWTGCSSSSNLTCIVSITADTAVTAAYISPNLLTPTVTVTPTPASITTAQSLSVTIAVAGPTGGATPTGSITLTSGTYTSAATTLAAGSATITVPANSLPAGTDTLTAAYLPDTAGSAIYNPATGTATVTVTASMPQPAVTLTADPTSIASGASSTLTWSSTNATSCTASGGWTGTEATSGTQSVSPASTTTYTLTCTGAGGSANATATVTVTSSMPEPTVTLTANPTSIASGASSTLTWSSTNATSCTASGGWTGTEATSGTQSVSPTVTTSYTLTCTGTGGSANATATVTVTSSMPEPTVTLTANPTSIASGASSTLTWSSTNATSCTAGGGWTGTEATSGTQSVSPAATTSYTLTCTGAGGSAEATATVTVTSGTAPVVTLTASPTTVVLGSSSTLMWTSANTTSCTASGSWSSSLALNGNQSVTPSATGSFAYNIACTGPDGSANASVTLTVVSSITNFYIYQNDDGTGNEGLNALWDNDYSFGQSSTTALDYTDTTHPESGHTDDLLDDGIGWQPAVDTQFLTGKAPFGLDISPYTWMTFDIWTAFPTDTYDSNWEYLGDINGNQTDQPTPAYLPSILQLPGIGSLNASNWTTVKIPLAYVGNLGVHAAYKFFLRDNTSPAQTFYLDNVGLVPGSYSWIYDGGAVNSWNASTSNWNSDPSAPINGWADATPAGATANYNFNPGTLSATLTHGASSLNGLVAPGNGTSIVSTNAIELSVTSAGGMWQVTNSQGFTLSPYTYLTFGLLPTNSKHSYLVQFYSTSGQPIGTATDPATYTYQDWGSTGQYWTIYSIPLSAFGSLPATVGGLSIQDTSGLSTNTIYITAPGFFN